MNGLQHKWGENMTKDDYKKIGAIRKRAVLLDICCPMDSMRLEMDMELAFKHFNLDLNKLLKFDDFNFAHDIYGIQRHIDRQTKSFDDHFVPRCSHPKKG